MNALDHLTNWLNTLYGIEQSLVRVLQNHARDAQDHPEIRRRLEKHLNETQLHADRVKQCLDILGTKPSTAKAMLGNFIGMVEGASTGMFRDELMKNFIADYAMEHFEIASYRAAIAAAEELGEPEVARICREILEQEEAMAHWLLEQIPDVTRTTLRQLTHA